MYVPQKFAMGAARYAFAVFHDVYARMNAQDRYDTARMLSSFGKASQDAQSHPRNLYDVSFLEKGCIFIFLAQFNEIIGACKLGAKRLFQFAEGETFELVAPCLLDVFVFSQHRGKHIFPQIVSMIERFTQLRFNLFALDDPPQEFLQLLSWRCADQASRFSQQSEAILTISKALRVARLKHGRGKFDGGASFDMVERYREYLPESCTTYGGPFEALDLTYGEKSLHQEYYQYLTYQGPATVSYISAQYTPANQQQAETMSNMPIEISPSEYEDFLKFRAERLAQKREYYEVNDKQVNVPARQIDMKNMGYYPHYPTRVNVYQAQAYAYQESEEAVYRERFKPQYMGIQTSRAPIVNYQTAERQQGNMAYSSPKSVQSDTSELQANRANYMGSKIQFGGFYEGRDDTYRRRNDFVTMNDMARLESERKVQTQHNARGAERRW